MPLDRKHEQKLWDAFRKPIDEAFNRKSAEREKAAAALSERDRTVLDASKALEAANASGDAQKIRAAMAALEAALRGQAQAGSGGCRRRTAPMVAPAAEPRRLPKRRARPRAEAAAAKLPSADAQPMRPAAEGDGAACGAAAPHARRSPRPSRWLPCAATTGLAMKKAEPMPAGRGGKFGDRKGGARRQVRRTPRRPRWPARRALRRRPFRRTVATRTVVRAWATWRSARSAKPWSMRSWPCRSSRRRPTAKR